MKRPYSQVNGPLDGFTSTSFAMNHEERRKFPMTKAYTVYSWVAKAGRDTEFVAAWREFAKWTVKQEGSTGSTRLFRDTSNPRHFMSVDSWRNEKALKTLREESEFNRQLNRLQRLLDNFSSWPLKLEAEEKPDERVQG